MPLVSWKALLQQLAFAKDQDLRKAAELCLRDCHFEARGHLAAG